MPPIENGDEIGGDEASAVERRTPLADLPELLSPDEFRAYTGIGRSTVYDLLRRGEIPHLKFGRCIRIPKAALTGPVR